MKKNNKDTLNKITDDEQSISKWNLSNHIIGKVYDLTQENMNAMIADIESLHTDSLKNYRESLEAYQEYIKNLKDENVRLKNALEEYIINAGDNRLGSRIAREALRKNE
jgi:hypothetical protein